MAKSCPVCGGHGGPPVELSLAAHQRGGGKVSHLWFNTAAHSLTYLAIINGLDYWEAGNLPYH